MSSSMITAVEYITVDFICSFNMKQFPFDVQVCKATLIPMPNSDVFVKLWAHYDIVYNGPKNLMKYVLTNFSFVDNNEASTFKVELLKLM